MHVSPIDFFLRTISDMYSQPKIGRIPRHNGADLALIPSPLGGGLGLGRMIKSGGLPRAGRAGGCAATLATRGFRMVSGGVSPRRAGFRNDIARNFCVIL